MKRINNFALYPLILFFSVLLCFANTTKPRVGVDEQLNKTVPLALKFTNSTGDTMTLGQIINKPTLLTLVYYHCQNLCTPLLDNLADAVNRIDLDAGRQYRLLTISFDQNETPAVAEKWKNRYLTELHKKIPADSWYFMVGDSVNIMALTNSVGFHFQCEGDGFIHPPAIIAISPKGIITRYILGTDFEPFDIKMAMIEAGNGMSQPTISRVLQFCYRFDPGGRKYVFNFTKVFGGILLLGVVVFVSILLVKGKKKKKTEGE